MESNYQTRFSGLQRLYGITAATRLRAAHVAVIGIGGVGSWAVEALARSGIGALTLVDFDEVCLSNINRQLPALTRTVGRSKVSVMKERILDINPECTVNAVEEFFTAANCDNVLGGGFDCVFDAVDSMPNKCLLLARCHSQRIPIITAGAAGGRTEPAAIRVADLGSCTHDRLLQRVRKVLRRDHGFPAHSAFGIEAVYSPETPMYPKADGSVCAVREDGDMRLNCDTGFGTAAFITGTFGFVAAARIVRTLLQYRRK